MVKIKLSQQDYMVMLPHIAVDNIILYTISDLGLATGLKAWPWFFHGKMVFFSLWSENNPHRVTLPPYEHALSYQQFIKWF